jgi:hypothetical protein
MLVTEFADKEKNLPEGSGAGDFDGKPIRRSRGMIYWYRWGRHSFDIRVVRKVLGLPEEHDADKYFMEYSSYYGRDDDALRDILSEVREAMGARSFKEVMKAHDAALKAT